MNGLIAVVFWVGLVGGAAVVVYRFVMLPRRVMRLGRSVQRLSSTLQQRQADKAAGSPVAPINYLGLAGLGLFGVGVVVARTTSADTGLILMGIGIVMLLTGFTMVKANKDATDQTEHAQQQNGTAPSPRSDAPPPTTGAHPTPGPSADPLPQNEERPAPKSTELSSPRSNITAAQTKPTLRSPLDHDANTAPVPPERAPRFAATRVPAAAPAPAPAPAPRGRRNAVLLGAAVVVLAVFVAVAVGLHSSATTKPTVAVGVQPQTHAAGDPEQIILKPVDAQGSTQPGYLKDERERYQPIDCSDGRSSRSAVDPGIRDCGVTADDGNACWPTAGGSYVLCLTDPFKKVLSLRAATGTDTPLTASDKPPVPIALLLDDGTQCRVRIGGAWDSPVQHPDWVGFYGCTGTSSGGMVAIWAPPDSTDGIERGTTGWTVQFGDSQQPMTTRTITKAYFVGMA